MIRKICKRKRGLWLSCLIVSIQVVASIVFSLTTPHSVFAATITVNTIADELNADGDCSLREAIDSANTDAAVDACVAGAGFDIIEFDAPLSGGTIGLTIAELEIADDLIINGLGANDLTVDGNGFDVFRIELVDGITVVLTDMTIEDGEDGIAVNGDDNNVTVTDCRIIQQRTDDGLEINGDRNTVIADNIYLDENEDNLGIEGNNNNVTVTNSTIRFASEDGVEIDGNDNTVTVVNSTINDNGVFLGDPNDGFDVDGARNVVELQQVTFSSNREDGLDIEGANNDITVYNCTFKGNVSGGILIDDTTSTVVVKNSIIAQNIASDVSGDFNSNGYNLIGDGTGSTGFSGPSDQVGTDVDPIDPGLGDFLDLGTPGSGHFPLQPDSPAIDAGSNDNCPGTDQIGNPRPIDGDVNGIAVCDIGAIELQNDPPVSDSNGPYVAECAGSTTTVSLDGTGSSDPDGDPLTYAWTTDCPGGSFNDSTSEIPTLTVTTSASAVCPLNCNVTLTVSDGGDSVPDTTSVTILDTTSPVLSGVPGNVTVECDEVPEPATVTVTDNCDPSMTVNFSEVRTDGSCLDNYTLTRTWTATDDCGNSTSHVQTINVVDTIAPVITPPADVTIECDQSTDPSNTGTGMATATDTCDTDITPTYTDVEAPGVCPQEKTITRTWTATDDCGNSTSHVQTINVVDTIAPVITCDSPNTIIPPDAPTFFTATATDNCDESPSVVITGYDCYKYTKKGKRIDKTESCVVEMAGDQITILDSGGVDDHIAWTISATDNCGNISTLQCEVLVVNPAQ